MSDLKIASFPTGQAVGCDFLGRKAELARLQDAVFEDRSSISLVGPTRIGKSSLVSQALLNNAGREKQLHVQLCMSQMPNAFEFWTTLFSEVCIALQDADLWNSRLQEAADYVEGLTQHTDNWFTKFQSRCRILFRAIERANWRLVLLIDEFDGAPNVFGQNTASYQLLRSIYSEPQYCTSGVLISRRRLSLLEKNDPHLSSFHGVFDESFSLGAFDDASLEDLWHVLAQHGITLQPEAKQKFLDYTGGIPYLCNMFCRCLIYQKKQQKLNLGPDTIEEVFHSCLTAIDDYYKDLVEQLRADGYLEFACALALEPGSTQITNRVRAAMGSIGVLAEKPGEAPYFFTRDFMDYLRTRPLQLPLWDNIVLAEKKLKKIFGKVYPELASTKYSQFRGSQSSDVCREIEQRYLELRINWDTITKKSLTLTRRNSDPSILDVTDLSFVVRTIRYNWDKFSPFFPGEYPEWDGKLSRISDVRNLIAHAHSDSVPENERSLILRYCEELSKLPD